MIDDIVLGELAADSRASAPPKNASAGDARRAGQYRAQLPTMAWIAVVLAAACALVDFSMAPTFERLRTSGGPKAIEVAYFFGLIGCTLAQGNLLAAWLVWSEGPFLRRLVCHWMTAAALYGAWAIGVSLLVLPEGGARVACLTVALVVPLVSAAAQFPLWVTRQWFGWRITQAASEDQTPQEQPLTIRGLMGATVIVAMSLALARSVPLPTPQGGKELWAAWIVGFLAAAGISTIAMLPAGRMLLGMQRNRPALLWSGVYAAALISLVWIVRELLLRYALNSGPPILVYVMLSSLMLGYAATLMVAGSLARVCGYRLVQGRRRLTC